MTTIVVQSCIWIPKQLNLELRNKFREGESWENPKSETFPDVYCIGGRAEKSWGDAGGIGRAAYVWSGATEVIDNYR